MNSIPAYPQSILQSDKGITGGCDYSGRYEGMLLRDYFAGQAIIALLQTEGSSGKDRIAKWSYDVADEMLKVREKIS